MSTTTCPLIDLPFDVWLIVAHMLGSSDLYSLCLLSRPFEETLAPVLYSSIAWTGFFCLPKSKVYIKSPCLVFERRPSLRKYVRVVTLFPQRRPKANQQQVELRKDHIVEICAELERLPSLRAIRWDARHYLTFKYDFASFLIIETVMRMGTVQEVSLPGCSKVNHYPMPLEQPPIASEDTSFPISDGNKGGLVHLRYPCPNEYNAHIQISGHFQFLQSFSLSPITEIDQCVTIINEMPRLVELCLGLKIRCIHQWGREDAKPATLSKLRSLTIGITDRWYRASDYHAKMALIVHNCYELFANGSEVLQTFHVYSATLPLSNTPPLADDIMFEIIHNHKSTVRVLNFDNMTASRESLIALFSHCTQIQELGLGLIRDSNLNSFFDFAPSAAKLVYLKLVIDHTSLSITMSDVQTLLSQTFTRLRRLDIYLSGRATEKKKGSRYVSWERRSRGDKELGTTGEDIVVTHWDRQLRKLA